jgi:hypothetical protein
VAWYLCLPEGFFVDVDEVHGPTLLEPAEKGKSEILKFKVSEALKAEIEEAAKEMHLSVSAFTRLALAELIRQRNANAKEAA